MDVDISTFTPRLRMSRHSPMQYNKSSNNLASTLEAGPSRLPYFSQILDLDLDMKDMLLSDDQFSFSELNAPKISTTPTPTRSDNPAAVLRALLSRLPAHPPSPTQSHALSVQGSTERESDFDTLSESNAAPSVAQESLKHIFSKAIRDPDNTPQKARRRRNSIDASEVEASPRVEKERATNKGKRRSMSDDELEDESNRDPPQSKQSHRNVHSGLKWMATPRPPGRWLNTPKSSREVIEQDSPSDNVAQSDGDAPLATNDGLSYLKTPARAEAIHGFQSFSQTPKPPGGWVSTPAPVSAQSIPTNSSVDIPEQIQGLLTPVASLSKGSKLESKTPAVPGAWLATPAFKKSVLKVRFEPEVSTSTEKSVDSTKHLDPSSDRTISAVNGLGDGDDDLQQTKQLPSKSAPSPRRQKSPKSPKIRVLDAFGREQKPDVTNQERINDSPIPLRVVDAMGHEMDEVSHVEGIGATATLRYSQGELLSRIRNGLDDLAVDIEDFDKDNQLLSNDHDRLQQLTTISNRARGLRERLYSQTDGSRSLLSSTLDTKMSWLPANPRVYIFLIILQLSLVWLMYRVSINQARELWLNRYYDPFNPELHLYIFKFDASPHVLGSEDAGMTAWSSFVGHTWDMWIYFTGSMQFRFWQAWDKGAALQYDNAWTPT